MPGWSADSARRAVNAVVDPSRRRNGSCNTERFGPALALDPAEQVHHVSLSKAQEYCSWAGHRLPLEEASPGAMTSLQAFVHAPAAYFACREDQCT
jgi:formylglycine-generating enzyme required for sulfatase activity